MVSTALQPVSHSVSAGAPRSREPESGADRTQLSAASDALDPAVVNHVRSPGSVDASAATPDSQAASKRDADATEEEVRRLKARDTEVRAHEQAHAAAGGALAGAPSYKFERGPDGHSYAVSGEVSIDVSDVSNDPQATIRKMQQVKRAALAPQSPSDADHAVAAMADAKITAARLELNLGSKKPAEEQSSAQTANASRAGDAAHSAFGSDKHRNAAAAAAYRSASAPAPANGINVVS